MLDFKISTLSTLLILASVVQREDSTFHWIKLQKLILFISQWIACFDLSVLNYYNLAFLLVLFLIGTISLLNIKFFVFFVFIVFNCTSLFFFKGIAWDHVGCQWLRDIPKYICGRSKSPGYCTPTVFPIYQNRPVKTGKKYRQASLKSTNAGSFAPLDSRRAKTLSNLHFVGTSVFSSITGDSKEYHSMLIVSESKS